MDPMDVVLGDFKIYDAGSIRFGIGQVEMQTSSGLEAVIPPLNEALSAVRKIRHQYASYHHERG